MAGETRKVKERRKDISREVRHDTYKVRLHLRGQQFQSILTNLWQDQSENTLFSALFPEIFDIKVLVNWRHYLFQHVAFWIIICFHENYKLLHNSLNFTWSVENYRVNVTCPNSFEQKIELYIIVIIFSDY